MIRTPLVFSLETTLAKIVTLLIFLDEPINNRLLVEKILVSNHGRNEIESWEDILDINKFLHTKWQQRWSNNIHNKLFQIQPTLGEWRPASRKSRREQVVISRLQIGHTGLTHSFILKQEPQPQCLTCQTTCTVKHILIECRAFAVFRKRCFKVNNLTDLFENVKIDDILSFMRETELYQKIWQLKTG